MISITGVPGTGKTSVCKELNTMGYRCDSLDALCAECIESGEADIQCMDRITAGVTTTVESHYSHLLHCEYVVILEADEMDLKRRMEDRGYPDSKIEENLDVQRSGTIYYEALERIPAGRIFRINTSGLTTGEIAIRIIEIFGMAMKK